MRLEKRKKQEGYHDTLELIRQVEEEGLLKAPGHMKEEILKRSESIDYRLAVQTRRLSKKAEFYLYSAKVGVAVAAALFMIVTVPADISETCRIPGTKIERQQSFGSRVNEGMRTLDRMLDEVMNGMKENDGGYRR